MGASSSRLEEDKALKLCRERKKFVRQALDGRCAVAATHVTYIQTLKITGTSLRIFFEPENPIESSPYTSQNATPEPLGKSLSRFSFSSRSFSQRVDTNENAFASPTFQTSQMKFTGSFSRKVEEKPSVAVVGSVESSSIPNNTTPPSIDRSEPSILPINAPPPIPSGEPAWDYFFTSQSSDYINRVREDEKIPELEDEEEKVSFHQRESFQESEDEFDDEPSNDSLVRTYKNVNRVAESDLTAATMPAGNSLRSESESLNKEKSNSSPFLSPLRPTSSGLGFADDHYAKLAQTQENDRIKNTICPKDLYSSLKEIESLFCQASDSGKEVPRMLEANKFHFRPLIPGKERGLMSSSLLKSCFSCGDDPSTVQEEPAQNLTQYLTWHRTTSSRSSSSRNLPGIDVNDDMEDLTANHFCMNAGSHASTLDRLYAWERKLYDEVKASELVRKVYDQKCRLLRELESQGESSHKIDKTRAVVKDLHSRIRVAIHRIDTISKKIEDLRDQELLPQLEELIEGLRKMWEKMFECHKQQFVVISSACNNINSTKIPFQSDSHRQITVHLEQELISLSSTFKSWITSQKSYVESINQWLFKCVSLSKKPSKRKRRFEQPELRNYGPPIYVTCGVWLDSLNKLPVKEVSDSIKGLAAEISHFLPATNHHSTAKKGLKSDSDLGANLLRQEEAISDDRVRSSLVSFLEQLSNFSNFSVKMYVDLQNSIKNAKRSYAQGGSSHNPHFS
jgi:flagellar biosynthesis/type III secretory pathway chaperone